MGQISCFSRRVRRASRNSAAAFSVCTGLVHRHKLTRSQEVRQALQCHDISPPPHPAGFCRQPGSHYPISEAHPRQGCPECSLTFQRPLLCPLEDTDSPPHQMSKLARRISSSACVNGWMGKARWVRRRPCNLDTFRVELIDRTTEGGKYGDGDADEGRRKGELERTCGAEN